MSTSNAAVPSYIPSSCILESPPPFYFDQDSPPINQPAPDYSQELGSDEVYLGSTPLSAEHQRSRTNSTTTYTYTSKYLKVWLGSRSPGDPQAPAIGRRGVIEGWVEVESLKHVEKLEWKVEGHVSTTSIEQGIPKYAAHEVVLSHCETLYPPGANRDGSSTKFNFSFTFPAHCSKRPEPLPPSFYVAYANYEGGVRYSVRFDLTRRGFRRNEKLEAVILYLPRSAPPSIPTLVHAAQESSHDFQTFSLNATPCNDSPFEVKLGLLPPLSYKSGSPIPIQLSLSAIDPSSRTLAAPLPTLFAGTTIHLLKITTTKVFEKTHVHEDVMAKLGARQLSVTEVGRSSVVATGEICGGRERGELAWAVDNAIKVSYAIRVCIRPSTPNVQLGRSSMNGYQGSLVYSHIQPIELTTHSLEEIVQQPSEMQGPSTGLISLRCIAR